MGKGGDFPLTIKEKSGRKGDRGWKKSGTNFIPVSSLFL